jgi:competence protein ComEA
MWKDWLYFTKRERNGIFFLLIILLIMVGVRFYLSRYYQPQPFDYSPFKHAIDSFFEAQRLDSIRWAHDKEDFLDADNLFAFDPNTIDSAGLRSLGFGSITIENLLKYRSAGGKFREAEDLGRIFSISDDELNVLIPVIEIAAEQKQERKPKKVYEPAIKTPASEKPTRVWKVETIDINSATAQELERLPGIGAVLSKRIVTFRDRLGGFYSKNQLSEVYGLSAETIGLIVPVISLNDSLIQRIDVNTVSVERLRSHPYLTFYQAKAIYDARKAKGRLADMNAVYDIPKIDTLNFHKVSHYLLFSE